LLIECVDACFGLARKKTWNQTSIVPRHGTLLFCDQDDVDNYVNNYVMKQGKTSVQVNSKEDVWPTSPYRIDTRCGIG
jgi:hypothetical protein